MVATPNASGKSLCYHLATLEAILDDKDGRAIYIFPTKALAQDQLRSLREIACPEFLSESAISVFDGDTPYAERTGVKKQARGSTHQPGYAPFWYFTQSSIVVQTVSASEVCGDRRSSCLSRCFWLSCG